MRWTSMYSGMGSAPRSVEKLDTRTVGTPKACWDRRSVPSSGVPATQFSAGLVAADPGALVLDRRRVLHVGRLRGRRRASEWDASDRRNGGPGSGSATGAQIAEAAAQASGVEQPQPGGLPRR